MEDQGDARQEAKGIMAAIDYTRFVAEAKAPSIEELATFLEAELPYEWVDAYRLVTDYDPNIWRIRVESFEYLFDHVTELVQRNDLATEDAGDDRVVAVHGRSNPGVEPRPESILRGAPRGAAEVLPDLGAKGYDRGHLMAHSIGGSTFINIFPQLSGVNRGKSKHGREFRAMERYCSKHPGTYCFARPIYDGPTFLPAALEYGVLKQDGELWVRLFPNVADPEDVAAMNRAFDERFGHKR
ncbi:MAG: DNA/RNA non-specific endonuclease [Thermoanaerobaculales bacterium]